MKLFKKHISSHGQKLYGPPEMLEERRNKEEKEQKEKKPLFSARRNRAKCIYGPPEMLEARRRGDKYPPRKNNPAEGIYGPPEMFGLTNDEPSLSPKENIAEDVYGPPEMLGALGYHKDEPDDEDENE